MTAPKSHSEVKDNLDAILADNSISLDIPAIEKLKIEITTNTALSVPSSLLSQIAQLLPVLQEDPTPLTTLGTKSATFLNFSDITSIDPPVNLIAGLKAPSPPVNLLALSVLQRASATPAEAAIVANQSDLVASLIELWLSTSATDVTQAASEVLWSLLEIDYVRSPVDQAEEGKDGTAEGTGLMWRRVFGDGDIYKLFYYFCSLQSQGTANNLSKREKTIAQGRLMDFVVKVGSLDWKSITTCHHPDIDREYRSSNLLHFTACIMVDTKDVLMHMTLLNFYRDLLEINAPVLNLAQLSSSTSPYSSLALDFLVSNKLHQKLLDLYLDQARIDPVDQMFLLNPIMAYISQYARLYPNHVLLNPRSLLDSILSRIQQALAIPSAQWAHGTVPTGDLDILSSLPRVLLVDATRRSLNPISVIPTTPANKECLHALSRLFHPPTQPKQANLFENTIQAPTDAYREAVAARILYFNYLNGHGNFWQHVVTAADIVAMQDVALTAISLIIAVTTAEWQTLSSEDAERFQVDVPFKLPSEDELNMASSPTPGVLPKSGAWAILTPPALTTVLPYLFKPAQSYNNFVGGGRGDAENAVWRLATAKYDALVALHNTLQGSAGQAEGLTDILRTLSRRVREGPWNPPNEVGTRVEAVEM